MLRKLTLPLLLLFLMLSLLLLLLLPCLLLLLPLLLLLYLLLSRLLLLLLTFVGQSGGDFQQVDVSVWGGDRHRHRLNGCRSCGSRRSHRRGLEETDTRSDSTVLLLLLLIPFLLLLEDGGRVEKEVVWK